MLFQQGTISVDERFARFGEKSYAINKITFVEVRSETKKGSSAFLAWWLIALTFAVRAIATLSAVSAVFALLFVGVWWKIGRASCREGVCRYVLISVVAVALQKKK